jgi:hypothetical protein
MGRNSGIDAQPAHLCMRIRECCQCARRTLFPLVYFSIPIDDSKTHTLRPRWAGPHICSNTTSCSARMSTSAEYFDAVSPYTCFVPHGRMVTIHLTEEHPHQWYAPMPLSAPYLAFITEGCLFSASDRWRFATYYCRCGRGLLCGREHEADLLESAFMAGMLFGAGLALRCVHVMISCMFALGVDTSRSPQASLGT